MRKWLRHIGLAGLPAFVWLWATPAAAIADFAVSLNATLTFGGASLPIFTFMNPEESIQFDNDPASFPSFINSSASSGWDAAAKTLTIDAASNGAANFVGPPPDLAEVGGMTRISSTIGIYNPSEFGFFLDITLQGLFEYAGFTTNDNLEWASTVFALSFFGNALDGVPLDTLLEERTSTRDGPLAGPWREDYDLLTTTFFLGVDETYSVLIPPSDVEVSPGTIERTIWSLGLFGQVGGVATSLDAAAGSAVILDEIPQAPDAISPAEFVPEPGVAALLLGAVISYGLAGLGRPRTADEGNGPPRPAAP